MAEFETPSTFQQERVEPTEIEKLATRLENYTIPIKPNTVNAIKAIMELGLSNGMFKADDLDAIITIREETNKGIIEYQTQMKRGQEQFAMLQAKEVENQQIALNEQRAKEVQLVIDERILRKQTENRLAQMEAVLAKQGLSIDLDGDGVIGLPTGQVEDTLTTSEKQQVADMLAQSRAAVDSVPYEHRMPVPPVETVAPVETLLPPVEPTGQPGPAFKLARMMNPVTEPSPSEEMQAELEPISTDPEFVTKVTSEDAKKSFAEFTSSTEDEGYSPNAIISGTTSEEFFAETKLAEEVEEAEQIDDAQIEAELAELLTDLPKVTEEPSTLLSTGSVPQSETTAPFLTGGNAPNLNGVIGNAPNIKAQLTEDEPTLDIGYEQPVIGEDDVVLKQDNIRTIENYEETEEEFDEITIPNKGDLMKMTKSEIEAVSITLGFEVSTKTTKAKMIEAFEEKALVLIAELTGSDEFVSAVESDEADSDGDSNSRDGGYF
jgi:hypothetical protein|tara:strand:- start:4398 stop:5873 length:1476 start_codon:yes stop_codon:yes gene_type:complete